MQTLGLASESKRSDGRLKSLFWPTVENAWDVDYLFQQGLWICTVVAVLTLWSTFWTGSVLLICLGLLAALFYVMGGMGVRQGNWPAAALVFAVYLVVLLAGGINLYPFGILRLAVAALLLANVRAAFLASEWKPAEEGEDRPTRFKDSLSDIYIDQLPQMLWPKMQLGFIVVGVAMLLLSLASLGFVLAGRFGLMATH